MTTLILLAALAAPAADYQCNGELKVTLKGPGVKDKAFDFQSFVIRINDSGTFSARAEDGSLLFMGNWIGDPAKKLTLTAVSVEPIAVEIAEFYLGSTPESVDVRKLRIVLNVRKRTYKYKFKTLFLYPSFDSKYKYTEKGKGTI